MCGYSFSSKYLHYPIIQQEEGIEAFLRRAPYYVFRHSNKNDESISDSVKSILSKNIDQELPHAAKIANILNMSTSTLHRKLAQEKNSFQCIKDETRMKTAIHYLNNPDITTSAIAERIGFENPSTFYRAFKKWTGIPPGEYRKNLS